MLNFFNTFDFGKSLLKQLEQLRSMPLAQQQKREQVLLKSYEKFVQQYMEKLNNQSNVNPANLKFGAEALVEAAHQLREPRLAYQAYAEMVARSRKVPVVPGLAALVDRLLELKTEQKEERISLLNWRIVTGSMRPERQLAYLSERAELTGAVSDWKDFSWNVSQLVSKGQIQIDEQLALDALNMLLKNKSKLGDRLGPVQMLMAEALMAQNKFRQAEIQLTDLATESKNLPEKFLSLVAQLIAEYPETNWMLQQMLLEPTVTALLEGKLNWAAASERFDRARSHTTQLIEFLLEHEKLTEEDRLGVYCLERICSLERHEADPQYDRWRELYRSAGRELPAGSSEIVEKAVATGHLTKRDVAKVASIELGPALLACQERGDVARVLNSNVPMETLSAQRVDEINSELANPQLSDWVVEETRLWLAERLSRLGRLDSAARQLTSIPVLNEKHASQLYPRIAGMFAGSSIPPQIQSLLARMSLLGGDYHGAFAAAQQLPADNPARGQLLNALEEWILAQLDAPAPMLLVLAQTQRLSHGDPAAGLQAATTASLLEPDSESIQSVYRSWEHALSPDIVYAQRAHQAAYLAEQQRNHELIPIALDAIEKLEQARGDEQSRDSLSLLEQMKPLLLSVPIEQQQAIATRWARMLLLVRFKANDESEIAAAIEEVTPLVSSEELNNLLSEFAGQLAPVRRLQVEYMPALQSGNWERALELCQAASGELVSNLVSVPVFCQRCPASAIVEATRRFAAILAHSGDDAGGLQLIDGMQERLNSDSALPGASDLRAILNENLLLLCAQPYEPAIRYRLDWLRSIGDLDSVAGELMALAKTGDHDALVDVAELFEQRIKSGENPGQTKEMALVLAAQALDEDPKRAVDFITRAGRAVNDAQWAVEAIGDLELSTETAEGLALIADLALQQGDLPKAQAVMHRLTELGAIEQAQKLADALSQAQPDSPAAMQSLLLVQLGAQPRDCVAAQENLFKLAEMLRTDGIDLSSGLQPIATAAESNIGYDSTAENLEFRLALALLRGDQFKAGQLMNELLRHGAPAATRMLDLLGRCGVSESQLPSGMIVGWSRAQFVLGHGDRALELLQRLRDEVEDFPEYIALLEEIKDRMGGAGPSLQLAEAYLKVSLWQRSAEEYQLALRSDPTVAPVVLSQLREQGALAPNPMKYPLHVAGLEAVINSSTTEDWTWAVNALSWLVPRWDPAELNALGEALWEKSAAVSDLAAEQRVQLAVYLYHLAIRQQDFVRGLNYLTAAWSLAPEPGPELRDALSSFDRGRLPADPEVQERLLRFELQVAVATGDAERVMQAAQRLSDISPEGREYASSVLGQFQASAADPVMVLLQRMRFVDFSKEEQRGAFLSELETLTVEKLTDEQLKPIVKALAGQLRLLPDEPDLQLMMLRTLKRYGDQARAWHYARTLAYGRGVVAEAALAELRQAAEDDFATGTREVLAAVLLARGEAQEAAQLLLVLAPETASADAATLAESLLGSSADASVRDWLVAYYRAQGNEALAADHVLWAQQAGVVLDDSWLKDARSGDVLLRAARLAGLRGSADERSLYELAIESGSLDALSAASAGRRLAELALDASDLAAAEKWMMQAQSAAPELPELSALQQRLLGAQRESGLAEMRAQPDSQERSLALAEMLRGMADVPAAIAELQGAIGRGQTGPEVYVALAECFTANGDLNLGRRAFADVLRKLETQDGAAPELKLRACYGLASAEEALGNTAAAISALEDILVVSATYRDTKSRLETLYAAGKGQPAAPPNTAPSAPPPPATPAGKDEILDELMALLDLDEGGK